MYLLTINYYRISINLLARIFLDYISIAWNTFLSASRSQTETLPIDCNLVGRKQLRHPLYIIMHSIAHRVQ
jgi:hypothetical protein